jgi:hypothetical protein
MAHHIPVRPRKSRSNKDLKDILDFISNSAVIGGAANVLVIALTEVEFLVNSLWPLCPLGATHHLALDR